MGRLSSLFKGGSDVEVTVTDSSGKIIQQESFDLNDSKKRSTAKPHKRNARNSSKAIGNPQKT